MKVSVISHDLSHNCLGRAHVLARLLQDRHDVEIVGRVMGDDVWKPLRDDTSVAYRPLDRSLPVREAIAAVDGDLLLSVKPKGASLGLALRARHQRQRPLIADIDDWETAFFLDNPKWMLRNLVDVRSTSNVWATVAMEAAVRRADAVTVSSTWLQRRFGGVVVPHARDGAALDGQRERGRPVRAELGLNAGDPLILFLGSPRVHKGLDVIVNALDRLGDHGYTFLVVGAEPGAGLPSRPWLRARSAVPFADLPSYLAAADVVVLAQRATRAASAQMPAKVYDALAMGTPVISSALSDLPAVLSGCGVTVPPDDPGAVASALRRVLGDADLRARLSSRGRERFLAEWSYDAVRPVMNGVVDSVLERVAA